MNSCIDGRRSGGSRRQRLRHGPHMRCSVTAHNAAAEAFAWHRRRPALVTSDKRPNRLPTIKAMPVAL
jgi:hypothetical protein